MSHPPALLVRESEPGIEYARGSELPGSLLLKTYMGYSLISQRYD